MGSGRPSSSTSPAKLSERGVRLTVGHWGRDLTGSHWSGAATLSADASTLSTRSPAVPEYKIRYRDTRTHEVTADKYVEHDDFFVFVRSGKDVFSVSRTQVESVGLAGIPDPDYADTATS